MAHPNIETPPSSITTFFENLTIKFPINNYTLLISPVEPNSLSINIRQRSLLFAQLTITRRTFVTRILAITSSHASHFLVLTYSHAFHDLVRRATFLLLALPLSSNATLPISPLIAVHLFSP